MLRHHGAVPPGMREGPITAGRPEAMDMTWRTGNKAALDCQLQPLKPTQLSSAADLS